MTVLQLLREVRTLLAAGEVTPLTGLGIPVFEALELVGQDHRDIEADALELLDALTPHPYAFLLWADGAEAVVEGDKTAFVYHYDRKLPDVLALLGRACVRAVRNQRLGAARVSP